MVRATHEDGGETAAYISMLYLIIMMSLTNLDTLSKVTACLVCYPGILMCADLCSKLPDSDLGLEQLPVKKYVGYLLKAMVSKYKGTHRNSMLHCLTFYSRKFVPLLIILITLYFVTYRELILMISSLVLSCYLGFVSHLILDGYTMVGFNLTESKKISLINTTDFVKSLHIKWVLFIPIIYTRKVEVGFSGKKTGGPYEFIIRNNVNLINRMLVKVILLTLTINPILLFTLIKNIILN